MFYRHDVDNAIRRIVLLNSVYKDRVMRSYEIIIERRMRSLFEGMEKEIIKMLDKKRGLDLSPTEMRKVLEEIEKYKEDYYTGLKEVKDRVGQTGRNRVIRQMQLAGLEVPYSSITARIKELLAADALAATEHGIETIKNQVSNILIKAYEDGIGHKETAKRITDKFISMDEFQARSIARTEVNSAQSRAKFETMREQHGHEDSIFKQWWTAEDERVRDGTISDADHVEMHGQIAHLDAPFSNGLFFPGDKNGDVEEWINCRCTIVTFIMPYGYMAPPGASYFHEGDIIKVA